MTVVINNKFNKEKEWLSLYSLFEESERIELEDIDSFSLPWYLMEIDPDWGNEKAGHWLDTINEIPSLIKTLANKKKLIIVCHIPEMIYDLQAFSNYAEYLYHENGIDPSAIKILSGVRLKPHPNIHKSFVFYPTFLYSFSKLIQTNDIIKETLISDISIKRRNKKFTCINRIDKPYRFTFMVMLHAAGILNEGYTSYQSIWYGASLPHEPNSLIWGADHLTENAEKFKKIIPFECDSEGYNSTFQSSPTKFYNDAYWNFVTETSFCERSGYLSEKTFKPIMSFQPFMIIGPPNSLTTLHELGFQTFGGFIDESYDMIIDGNKRIEAIVKVAIQLTKMSHDEHISLIIRMLPILKHNQHHFFSSKYDRKLVRYD